ncbi:MAG: response regulator [Bdellovibrionales bacterium]|nr:response regulator [Bdellovibrionales bacterium]
MKPTLIIADDLEEIREKLYNALLEEFEILADVENGQKAVEAVRRYRPQLVLMDVVMPVLSGIEAVRILHAENPESPKFVMLSGLKEESVVLQALQAGASEYLFKPVEPKKLKEVLWNLVRAQLRAKA